MELEITKNVKDKVTGETFVPGDVIERSKERGEAFLKAKVAKEVKAKTPEKVEEVLTNQEGEEITGQDEVPGASGEEKPAPKKETPKKVPAKKKGGKKK